MRCLRCESEDVQQARRGQGTMALSTDMHECRACGARFSDAMEGLDSFRDGGVVEFMEKMKIDTQRVGDALRSLEEMVKRGNQKILDAIRAAHPLDPYIAPPPEQPPAPVPPCKIEWPVIPSPDVTWDAPNSFTTGCPAVRTPDVIVTRT